MSCYTCRNSICCPEHCCDWDSCRCGDCENCGGVARDLDTLSNASTKIDPEESKSRAFVAEKLSESQNSIHDEIRLRVQQRMKEEREKEAEILKAQEEKRKIERERHEQILSSSRATIEKNKQVLESTQGTLDRLQGVINGIKDTEQKFKDFQDAFGKIMSDGLEKCFGLENVEEAISKYGAPKESSIEEVSSIISSANSVSFITGAGVSAESGVFTYKDNKETWEIDGKELSLQDVMHIDILQTYPLEFWQNIQYNRSRFSMCSPNGVHFAMADLLCFLRGTQKKMTLVTQNIDGFDRQILENNEDLFEIHGNTHYMRCLFECCEDVFECPEISDLLYSIPLCPYCGAIARPNVLLYGESYTEKWYRSETASKAVSDSDVLVVVGTQLKCGFPFTCVQNFAKQGKPIIEINVEPVVKYGNVFVLPRTCGEVVPAIVEAVKSMG